MEDPLTLAKALEIAKGMELAAKILLLSIQIIKVSAQGPVHQIQNLSTVTSCYHCGG